MKKLFSLPNEPASLQVDHFRTRLKTRLFVISIFIIQIAQRIYFNYGRGNVSKNAKDLFTLSMPFLIGEILIILAECFLYKKIGSRILKYIAYIDFVFFLCFTAEWILTWYAALSKYTGTAADCIGISSLIAFSSFAWRTQIQNLIIQHWIFKSLAPMAIYGIMMGYVVSAQPSMMDFNLTRGITNALFTMMIFYVESKISYKLLLVNLKQEKWMHVNQFILNNIPEKIAILDLNGEVKYTTDYFKTFLHRWHYSQNIEKFFHEVQNLQRQYELDSFNLPIFDNHPFDRSSSTISRRNDSEIEKTTFEKIPSLEILIKQFRTLIQNHQIQQKSFLSFSGTLKLQDSPDRSIELKISYIHQDSHPYIILILKDTTQRNLLITLESTNKYKDQLLASVSHELRTPLNGNITLIEAALRDPTIADPVKEKFLVPALKSGQFLSHLINDILDTAQIRAQKLRLAFKPGNLRETLTNSSQLLQLQAKKKNIHLEIDLDPNLPSEICTDHSRLSQIVLNLLNNSIKFTKQGFVKLTAVPVSGSNCIRISVEDSGVGMDQQDIKKLFEDYTHIGREDMVQINPNGVGLGLSIAYNLAKLLGPENNKGIKVLSALDRGSTFSFMVENKQTEPIQSIQDDKQMNEEISLLKSEIDDIATEPVIDQKKFKSYSKRFPRAESSDVALITQREISECVPVLVVDDDTFNILAYESLLDALNIKYACVDNGKTAIDALLNKRCFGPGCKCFSLVLMDQEMPEMTGVETISEIKKLQRQDLIPEIDIIGCTAHQRKEDIDLLINAGAKECIQKPISMIQIQGIVQKYL